MNYIAYTVSFITIYIALATALYLQFSLTGITNFGIVGFYGLGMYAFSIFLITLKVPFLLSILLAMVLVFAVSLLLGRVLLNLSAQSVLVGTLAFATIIENAVITEKWLTNGVLGFGTVKIPFKINNITTTAIVYAVILLVLTAAFVLYAYKVKNTPYGRLLLSIKDNEPLSKSLGKSTFNHKILFFAVTSAIVALFGALSAPLYMTIYPRILGPGLTFTIWIALLIGGRTKVWGAIVGVLATVGLFDYLIVSVFNYPPRFASMYPNIKYAVFGLALILIFMFMPNGIIADRKRKGASIK